MHLVRRAVALAMVLASGTVAAAAMSAPASASAPRPATSAPAASGAVLPFTEYSAAGAKTNGTRIGPSTNFGQLPAEAVGRRAVTLSGTGRYIEFTLTKAANALDLHY